MSEDKILFYINVTSIVFPFPLKFVRSTSYNKGIKTKYSEKEQTGNEGCITKKGLGRNETSFFPITQKLDECIVITCT